MTSVRHVLMTTDVAGGVWSYSVELARGLSSQGVRVSLATLGGYASRSQTEEVFAIEGVSLYQSRFKLEWMDDPWDEVEASGEWLKNLTLTLKPDLIHLNSFALGSVSFGVPSLVVAHSDVMSWWTAVKGGTPPSHWSVYRRRVQSGLTGAGAVIAVSHWMAEAVAEHYGVERPAVVWNGRDWSEFRPAAKQDMVLACGRMWDEGKNVTLLDSIAARLRFPVYIAGSSTSPDGKTVRPSRAHCLGVLSAPEVKDWYAKAAIYALPARYEPFGLSVLEAALSGCALILSDIPTFQELWCGCAMFVSPSDPDGWVQAIEGLSQDPERRQQLAAAARMRARQYNSRQMLEGYLATYAAVAVKQQENATCRS